MNDDLFKSILSKGSLVQADGDFRARLRQEAQAVYARRTRALRVGGLPRRVVAYLPWGFAAAASVLAIFFHLQGDTGMIRSLEGATLARHGDEWIRVGPKDKVLTNELYVAPGARSEVNRPGVKAVLENDCLANFNDAERSLQLDGGVAEVEGKDYKVALPNGDEVKINGRAKVDCNTGVVIVINGKILHNFSGQVRQVPAGGQVNLTLTRKPVPKNSLLSKLAPGQSLGDILKPLADGKVEPLSREGQIRLDLFCRLGGTQEDLKAAFVLLDSLKGSNRQKSLEPATQLYSRLGGNPGMLRAALNVVDSVDAAQRQKIWEALSQAPIHKVLDAEQAVAPKVVSAVKVTSSLGVEYLVERVSTDSFQVTRSGRTDVWNAATLKHELDPELVASLPAEWKLGKSE
ncbi:MAG: hypothetical protein AB7F75_06810 [Planctomycetota bacterium]